jgi:hypothetical protein
MILGNSVSKNVEIHSSKHVRWKVLMHGRVESIIDFISVEEYRGENAPVNSSQSYKEVHKKRGSSYIAACARITGNG